MNNQSSADTGPTPNAFEDIKWTSFLDATVWASGTSHSVRDMKHPVDLRPRLTISAGTENPANRNHGQLTTLSTYSNPDNITPACYAPSIPGSRSSSVFGKLATSRFDDSGPARTQIAVIVSCQATEQGYHYRGDLWPGASFLRPEKDALLKTLYTQFDSFVDEEDNLAIIRLSCLSGSLRRDPGSKVAHRDQTFLAAKDLATLLRTRISLSSVGQLEDYFKVKIAKPEFYDWHKQSCKNLSAESKPPEGMLVKVYSRRDDHKLSDALVQRMIQTLDNSLTMKPFAKWESNGESVTLKVIQAANEDHQDPEISTGVQHKFGDLQSYTKLMALEIGKSATPSRSPAPLSRSSEAGTSLVPHSNRAAIRPHQKSPRSQSSEHSTEMHHNFDNLQPPSKRLAIKTGRSDMPSRSPSPLRSLITNPVLNHDRTARRRQRYARLLPVPRATGSAASSEQSSRPNSPLSDTSQYEDYPPSDDSRCPSRPLGELQTFNQNVQALQNLNVNIDRYNHMQPSSVSNAQQDPQQFQSMAHASYPPNNTSNYNDRNTFYPPTAPTLPTPQTSTFVPRQKPGMVNPQRYPQQYQSVVQTSFPANHTLNFNDQATTQLPIAQTLSFPQVNSSYHQPSQQNYPPDLDLAGPESWFAATAPQPALNQHFGNSFFGQSTQGQQPDKSAASTYAPTNHMVPPTDMTSRRNRMNPQNSNNPGHSDTQLYSDRKGMEAYPLRSSEKQRDMDNALWDRVFDDKGRC